jgi:hypothetical protein
MSSAVDRFAGARPIRPSIGWRAGRGRPPRRRLPSHPLPCDVLKGEVME